MLPGDKLQWLVAKSLKTKQLKWNGAGGQEAKREQSPAG